MRDPRPLIVVAGESLVDRIVRPDGRVEQVAGGGPFTTARALARLGARVAFVGRLSTDPHGRILRELLEADGVDLSLAPATDEPTLIAHAAVDAAGSATYRFEPPGSAAAGLRPEDLTTRLPVDTAALHVGTLGLVLEPAATTIAGLVATATDDVLVMLDPNIRPAAIGEEAAYRARLAAVVARADVVKASADDLRWLDPDSPPVETARRLLDAGPSVVVATDGSRPVLLVTPSGVAEVPVPAAPVVDTVGAGDAFGAGFLAAWIAGGRGRTDLTDDAAVAEAVRFGVRVASWTIGRHGADSPTSAQLAARPPT